MCGWPLLRLHSGVQCKAVLLMEAHDSEFKIQKTLNIVTRALFLFFLSVTYHYEMDCPLPCSTLAVAVGWWQCRQSQNAETKNGSNPDLPVTCRLFAPPSLIDTAANELLGYAPRFLEASCELLGPYPFKRLDMLVLPKCFACMGLKRLAYRSKCQFSSLISTHWFEW